MLKKDDKGSYHNPGGVKEEHSIKSPTTSASAKAVRSLAEDKRLDLLVGTQVPTKEVFVDRISTAILVVLAFILGLAIAGYLAWRW